MRKIVAIFTIALLCCGFIPQHKAMKSKRDTRSVSELYTDAIKCLKIHKDTLAATKNLTVLFAKDSTNAEAIYLYSRITKDIKESVVFAEMAYKLDPTNRFYLEHYAQLLYNLDENKKALPLYKKIVEKSTNAVDFHHCAVLHITANNDTEAALKVLDEADARFGQLPGITQLRHKILIRTNRADEAEANAIKLIEKAPHITENYVSLADLYVETKRDSLAMVTYKRALAIDSTSIELLADYSSFCRNQGYIGEYFRVLKKLMLSNEVPVSAKISEWLSLTNAHEAYIRYFHLYDEIITSIYSLHRDNLDVKRCLALHLFYRKDEEEALKLYKECSKSSQPSVYDFHRIIDIESEYMSRADSAMLYLNRGLETFPLDVRLNFTKANIMRGDNKYDEAIHHYDVALRHEDNDTLRSFLLGNIGDVHHLRKDMKSCYKAYDAALALNSRNESVLNNYSYFLSLDGKNLKKALEMITLANEISENNPTFLDTKAWVLYKLGNYTEAKKVMQKALSLNRNNSYEYPLHYGHILYALGEEFMAKTYWRKALEACTNQEEVNEVQESIAKVLPKQKKQKK